MKDSLTHYAMEIAQSNKLAQIAVGASPAVAGAAKDASWVSENVGTLGIVLGGLASLTVIISNVIKIIQDRKRHKKEMELLDKKLKEK